jgi:glycerol-3-phosphate acyltransferase PlsY
MLVDIFYLNTAIILLVAYLIGAFPSAYIAGRIRGIDIKRSGTRNVGGMNTITSVGIIYGVIVALVDIGKGFLVAYLANMFSGSHPFIPLWAVLAAIIGHNWMIYLGFKGGKGVATLVGGLLFLSPWSILILFLVFIPITFALIKDSYLGTAAGFFILGFFLWIWEGSILWLLFGIILTAAYTLKCASLIVEYFTKRRRDIHPLLKKLFKPLFKDV